MEKTLVDTQSEALTVHKDLQEIKLGNMCYLCIYTPV
jgi:hypothetical protein